MAWDWSTHKGREGALRNLMISPGDIFERTNECWDALAPPKELWVAKIAKKARIKGSGKTVLFLLFQRMLREYKRRIRLLGRVEDMRDAADGIKHHHQTVEIWYAVAEKYSRFLDCEERVPDAPPGATILRGPWDHPEVPAVDPRPEPLPEMDRTAEASLSGSEEASAAVDPRVRIPDPRARSTDAFLGVLEDTLADIKLTSSEYFSAYGTDLPRDVPVFGLYAGLMYRMAEKILGAPCDGQESLIVVTQLALTRVLLEEEAPVELTFLVGTAMRRLGPKAYNFEEPAGIVLMFEYLMACTQSTPWISRDTVGNTIYYGLDHEALVRAYKERVPER